MNRIFRECASLAFVAVTVSATAATVSSGSLASATTLAIDGAIAARVLNWEGADLRGSVVAGPASSTGLATKRIGSAACAPLRVEVAFPPSAAVAACINDLCANRFTRHTLVLTEYSATSVATDAFEVSNALLTEVRFPAFDATSSSLGSITLVFSPESSRAIVPGSSAKGSVSAATGATTFALAIDGLDGKGVMRIEPITVTCSLEPTGVGETRVPAKEPGKVVFSNLVVTLSTAKASSWKTWWTDFVVKGRSDDANEKHGVLSPIGSTGKPVDPSLNFSQLGILRVSRVPVAAGAVARSEAELYFEGLKLETAATAPGDSTASSSSASSAGSESPGSTVESAEKAGAIESPAAIAPAIAERAPGGVEAPSIVSPRTAAVAAATKPASSVEDKGSRDPAEFPRVTGLVRQYYAGTFQPTYTSEQANYTSDEAIYDLVKRVEASAKAAGWTLGTFEESENAGDKNVGTSWTKASASASVHFQQKPIAPGTQLSLQVYVRTAP